jgi:hypothetical protein
MLAIRNTGSSMVAMGVGLVIVTSSHGEMRTMCARERSVLAKRSGNSKPAPATLGGLKHPPRDPAPGRYVLEK